MDKKKRQYRRRHGRMVWIMKGCKIGMLCVNLCSEDMIFKITEESRVKRKSVEGRIINFYVLQILAKKKKHRQSEDDKKLKEETIDQCKNEKNEILNREIGSDV